MNSGRSSTTSIAAVFTAIAASACCIGPPLLVALGLGGVGFARVFEPYRPYLLGATALLLGLAFWYAYRPLPAEACGPDGACTPQSRRRTRTMVWVAAVVALGAAAYPRIQGLRAAPAETVNEAQALLLEIGGMTCDACVNHVRGALEKVPGVEAAEVRLDTGEARVQVSPDGVDPQDLVHAVEAAGYEAHVRSGETGR